MAAGVISRRRELAILESAGIFFAVNLLLCVAAPLIVYCSINRENVSERLRQME